jgi:hypothetical protein
MNVRGPQPFGIGQAIVEPIPLGVRPTPMRGPRPMTRANAHISDQQLFTSFMPTPRFNPPRFNPPRAPRPWR